MSTGVSSPLRRLPNAEFMELLIHLLTGAFLVNCIPHLAAGLQGARFPTPFARFRGARVSSALVNVWWGSFNAAIGVVLLHRWPVPLEPGPAALAFAIGFVGLGSLCAVHFGTVMEAER